MITWSVNTATVTWPQVNLPDDDPTGFLPQIRSDFIIIFIILIICQNKTSHTRDQWSIPAARDQYRSVVMVTSVFFSPELNILKTRNSFLLLSVFKNCKRENHHNRNKIWKRFIINERWIFNPKTHGICNNILIYWMVVILLLGQAAALSRTGTTGSNQRVRRTEPAKDQLAQSSQPWPQSTRVRVKTE